MSNPVYIKGDKGDMGMQGPCGAMGMMGPPGKVLVSNGLLTAWQTPPVNSGTVIMNDVVLTGSEGQEATVGEVVDFMRAIKDRLLILTPNFEKHEKFPALKEMYDQYRVMERLMIEDLKKDE
jgi:hypothetical protein